MKGKPLLITLFVFFILIAFITNPEREKHAENATDIILNNNSNEEGNLGILGGLMGTFFKETISGNLKIKNYYLFSISHIYSPIRDKKLNLGFGIFGQVFPLASQEAVETFRKSPSMDKEKGVGHEEDSRAPILKKTSKVLQSKSVEKEQDKSINDALNSIMAKPEK